MQREALIILAALLTLAVLGAGSAPEHLAEAQGTDAVMPGVSTAAEANVDSETVSYEHQLGPVQVQMVGATSETDASLTVNLAVAF